MAKIVLLGTELAERETAYDWLIADGHEVRVTHVGAAAIDFGYLFKPELLITDWRLKCEYDGIEVAKAFRSADNRTKTILLTDCSVSAAMHSAATANIFQIIMKPVSKFALLDAVSQAITENQAATSYN